MKKLKLTILLIFIALCGIFGQTQTAVTEAGKKVLLSPDGTWKYAESSNSITLSDEAGIVYITASGKKYHTANCTYLRGNGIPKKLSEVKDSYSPCSKCKPNSNSAREEAGSGPQTSVAERATNSSGAVKSENATGVNSRGQTIYTGPKGGRYHYNSSGKKVYERKKK